MEHKYNPVTPELVEELKKVVGDRYVKTDEEYLEQYQTDEEGNPHFFKKPEVVVFPGTTEEVAEVVKLANKYLVPITPGPPAPVWPAAPSPSIMAWWWNSSG